MTVCGINSCLHCLHVYIVHVYIVHVYSARRTLHVFPYTVNNKGTLEVSNGYSLCPYCSTLMGTLEFDFVESSVPFTVRIKRHISYPFRYALNGIERTNFCTISTAYSVPIFVKQLFR